MLKATTKFKRDLKLIKKRGWDLEKLTKAINTLKTGKLLNPQYFDHPLDGKYSEHRECHIDPDWLLIYQKDERNDILYLARTGSHSDLFG